MLPNPHGPQLTAVPPPKVSGFVAPRSLRRWVLPAAIASVLAGAILSHTFEPGVRVEKTTLAGDTPAIRICSTTPGAHPIALLAHGVTASKETLCRLAEALAAVGFDSYAVDLPGHGASPQPFSTHAVGLKPGEVAQALGSVDVFLGHSMGAGAGAWSVRESRLRPKLFVAFGANPNLGDHGPPLLILAGWFEEFIRPARLLARTDAQVVISPWSDHCLEPYDPYLVNSAVQAACNAVGLTPPHAAPTAWLWRFAGLVLGLAGALGIMFRLPELHPLLARARGILLPLILLIAVVLTSDTWGGAAPHLRRIPVQIMLLGVVWLALTGVGKLSMPRWTVAAFVGLLTIACLILGENVRGAFLFSHLVPILGISMLLLAFGTILAKIAARGGTRRDGDLAMAIFGSYAIGQCLPTFF